MEVIDNSYKQKIEEHAESYFGDLHIGMPPSMIATTISYFEFHLSKEGLNDEEDFDIHHSKLFTASSNWLVELEPVAFRVASIYGNEVIKLLEKKEKPCFSLAFVGYKHDVHASYVSLLKIFKLAKEAKKEYRKTLDSNLKPKEKKEFVDDYMYDWLEDIQESLSPTALTRDDYTDINEYIKNTFHTQKDQNDFDLAMAKFLQVLLDAGENATGKDVKDQYFEKYGQDLSSLVEKEKSLKNSPILIEWRNF